MVLLFTKAVGGILDATLRSITTPTYSTLLFGETWNTYVLQKGPQE